MRNITIIGIYTPFALSVLVILAIELRRRFRRREDFLFLLLCCCAIGWFSANILSLISKNHEAVKLFFNISLMFVGLIPPVLLLHTLSFYKVRYKPTRLATVLLFLIPAANTLVAATSGFHSLMTAQLDIVSLTPLRLFRLEWGAWFWVHTAYCYVVSATQIGVVLVRHFRLPRFYRLPSSLMVTGVLITLLGNVITLMNLLPQAMDPTLVTMSLSLLLFHLAIINNNRSRFVRFSHRQIYHYLNLYILVLDENRRVADYNRPAYDWFSARGIALGNQSIDRVTDALLAISDNGRAVFNGGEADFYIAADDITVVLNFQLHALTDAKGDVIGSIAVFTDVTQNRMLIEKLEKKAGMDSLTGLANRMAYEGTRQRLDNAGFYPLSVVMCDVNYLKDVNDRLGHSFGDRLLRTVARILETECPPGCFLARTGGDEFIYLLPHTSHDACAVLIARIKLAMSGRDNLPFSVSVALGAATKVSSDESLDDVIALADSRMYADKRKSKMQDLPDGHAEKFSRAVRMS